MVGFEYQESEQFSNLESLRGCTKRSMVRFLKIVSCPWMGLNRNQVTDGCLSRRCTHRCDKTIKSLAILSPVLDVSTTPEIINTLHNLVSEQMVLPALVRTIDSDSFPAPAWVGY